MSAPSDSERQVEKNLPWNFTVNLLDVGFYMLALNLVARQTILPLLVSRLTTSKLAIGLIPALDSLGFLLPQLLMAKYTEGLRRKLPFVATVGLTERLPYLVIGVIVWTLAEPAPHFVVVALFVLLTVHTFSGGIIMPAWFDLIAKVIPTQRRGFWTGLSHGLGALLGVVGAVVAGRILVERSYPTNFALIFFLAFGALVLSWIFLVLNREPDSTTIRTGTPLRAYLKRLPAIVRGNRNYLRLLISRGVTSLGGMATGFYVVYGLERWQISGAEVALLTAILTGSEALMNVIWGLVGDRRGHKLVLWAGAASLTLATVVAVLASGPAGLRVVFALLGASIAARSVSGMNIVLEFCADEDRPTYIGLTNTLLAPVAIIAPLIGGALAAAAGYQTMFLVAAVCAAFSTALLVFWVSEPRLTAARGTAVPGS